MDLLFRKGGSLAPREPPLAMGLKLHEDVLTLHTLMQIQFAT